MSYLMRNGTGRNNILYGGNNTTSGNYLRRTNTSINSIQWYIISSNGTYNILERYSTGRNDIRWNNIVFSFFSINLSKYNLQDRYLSGSGYYNMNFQSKYKYQFKIGSVNLNTYSNITKIGSSTGTNVDPFILFYYSEETVINAYNDIVSNCTKFVLKGVFDNISSSKEILIKNTESRYYIGSSYSYVIFNYNFDFSISSLTSITFS